MDTAWQMPIAKTVNVASRPENGFYNPAIQTSDVMLVSGLSFSGSSGRPVISHRKGFRATPPLQSDGFVPAKLIGIISGHWWNEDPTSGIFFHSGLSYLTRSTSLHELVTICRARSP